MELTDEERNKLVSYLPKDFQELDRLDVLIEMASFRVSRGHFGKSYVYALSLMVAHKAALEARGSEGNGGAVTSVREGDIAVSYANNGSSSNDGDLASTSYGQEYLALYRSRCTPAVMVTGGACGYRF